MSGLLGTFLLKDFDVFFDNYKSENVLADEALTALKHFLPVLNDFFDLCENLTDANNSKISWYSYTNITSNGDYIRAKSKYYNEPSFSNVSIRRKLRIIIQIKVHILARYSILFNYDTTVAIGYNEPV